MASKSTNNSISSQNGTKSNKRGGALPVFLNDYFSVKSWRMIPITLEKLEQIAKDLVYWADNDPKAHRLGQFYNKLGIEAKTFDLWCAKSDILRAAKEYAMEAIGNNRFMNALEGKWSSQLVMINQYQFFPEIKEAHLFHSELKKSEKAAVEQAASLIIQSALRRPDE